MKRQTATFDTLDGDLRAMLEYERVTPPLPDHIRARALARAVAFLTAMPTSHRSRAGYPGRAARVRGVAGERQDE